MRNELRYRTSIPLMRTKEHRVWRVYFIAIFFGILLVPSIFAIYGNSYIDGLLATILLALCCYPTARYLARGERGVPVLSILCLSYALQFAIPIFSREPEIDLVFGAASLKDADVSAALLLSVLGVGMLQAGYYSVNSERFARAIPFINLHLNEKKAIIYCLLVGALLPVFLGLRPILSESVSSQFSAAFGLLENQQLVVIGILGWIVYSGRGKKWHKVLLYAIVGVAVWRGISSAFLEKAIIPVAVLLVTKWLYGKRLSALSITAIMAIILFLSPAKASYRSAVWFDQSSAAENSNSPLGSAYLWVSQAAEYWADTLSGERDFAEATSSAAYRTDLIHQFAHIISLTPEVVPYQYGSTYSFFAVAFIPRAIWPDKPKAGSANDFFAVAYGITTEEGIKRVTYGVSLLGEGYINFGFFGVMFIMALQGGVLTLLQRIFGGPKSGAGGQAVFLAFFIFFLNGVGTSAEIFFGNILQNLLCSCALLWWAREKSSARELTEVRFAKFIPTK
jgi:hypothetical protein